MTKIQRAQYFLYHGPPAPRDSHRQPQVQYPSSSIENCNRLDHPPRPHCYPNLQSPVILCPWLQFLAPVRLGEIQRWAEWHDPGGINFLVGHVVVSLDVIDADGLGDSGLLVKVE